MLPDELVKDLNQYMNMEFHATGLYISRSSWLSEKGFIDATHVFRLLAQNSVTHVMKYYDFLIKNQAIPIINSDTVHSHEGYTSLKMIINEIYFDYQMRYHHLFEIEKHATAMNSIITVMFISKMKSLQINLPIALSSILKNYIL